jgi:hypothetical protein
MSKDIQKLKKHSMMDLVSKSKGSFMAPREVLEKIPRLAPDALDTLETLMKTSKADSVRLKAALEILALSGVQKDITLSVKTDITEMDDKEINGRLSDLLGTAAGVILDGSATDVTPTEEIH